MTNIIKHFAVIIAIVLATYGYSTATETLKNKTSKTSKSTVEFLSHKEVERHLKSLGVMYGNMTYVKSVDTDNSLWKAHIYSVKNEGMVFPMLVYVTDRDIAIGVLMRDGKLITPKMNLKELQIKADVFEITNKDRIVFNPDGKETIYMFTDPDCPYCQKAEKTLESYKGQFKIVLKSFPLEESHPGATQKSIERQCKWINKDCDSEAMEIAKKMVEEDIKEGYKLGVNGTPFFVSSTGEPIKKVSDLTW